MPISIGQRHEIAHLIENTRKRMNITQEQFGKKIFGNNQYYSKQSVSQWEGAKTIPNRSILTVMTTNKEKWIRDLANDLISVMELRKVQKVKTKSIE